MEPEEEIVFSDEEENEEKASVESDEDQSESEASLNDTPPR